MLLALERGGILSPTQREIVIDRLLALDNEELSLEQVKWVVLMVLSSQPGEEAGLRAHGRPGVSNCPCRCRIERARNQRQAQHPRHVRGFSF